MQSWDTTASSSDFVKVVFVNTGVVPAGVAYDETFYGPLSSTLTATQWNNVVWIDSIEIEIAWAGTDFEQIALEYASPITSQTRAGQLNGNNPSGTLNWITMTRVPATTRSWAKSDLNTYRDWLIENDNDIDATHRMISLQSITETVQYQTNSAACP